MIKKLLLLGVLVSSVFLISILSTRDAYAETRDECIRTCGAVEERPEKIEQCKKSCEGLPLAPEGTITNPLAGPLLTPTDERGPVAILGSVLRFIITALIVVAAVFFLFLLLVGGIRWMASGGDKAQIESARTSILNAVIGLILVFATFAIIAFIEAIFKIDLLQIDVESIRLR